MSPELQTRCDATAYRAAMSSLDDQAEVGRKGTTVTGTSGLLIWVWGREVIRQFSGALEHLAIIIGAVGVFDFLCQSPGLFDGMGDTDEVAPGDAVKGVARSANFAVDLEAATDTGRVGRTARLK